jgi:hypothetical protein
MAPSADFLKRLPLVLLFLLAACSWNEPTVVDVPKEIDSASGAFVAAVQKGDQQAAAKHVAPTAQDELAAQFASDSKTLKAAPKLTPRFITYKPASMMGPEDSEVTIIYAARTNNGWATMEVRLFRLGEERYEVDYWKISNDAPVAKSYTPDLRPMFGIFAAIAGVIVVLGIALIGTILWIVRRKPHIVSPPVESERRAAAITTRETSE